MGWLEFMTKNLYNTQGKVINKVVETLQHMDQEMTEEEENKQIKIYFWSLNYHQIYLEVVYDDLSSNKCCM